MKNGPVNGMWSSPFNEVALQGREQRERVYVADCTLRDGEQQAGIAFDHAAKVAIARALDELGVYEIEAGTPASSEEDRAAIAEMCNLGLRAKISVLCRAITADIDQAAELGVWGVRLSFPVSPTQRAAKLKGMSDEDYLRKALEITAYARAKGLYVIFSPYDTTRADLPFMLRLVRELEKAGTVDRLRVVDTTGCALPEAITFLVRQLREAAPKIPLEIHCHDDFGLACANTLAGATAGADFVSTTINGIGERSGNAATEEVALTLEGLYGVKTGLDLTKLTATSHLIEELSGVKLQSHKAVVGENSFRHEAGMVVAGVLADHYTAEAYDPGLVGQSRQILVGKKSGAVSIAYKVKQLGLSVPESRYQAVLTRVKEVAVHKHAALTDDEFRVLAEEFAHA